jgi:hypothetical protein
VVWVMVWSLGNRAKEKFTETGIISPVPFCGCRKLTRRILKTAEVILPCFFMLAINSTSFRNHQPVRINLITCNYLLKQVPSFKKWVASNTFFNSPLVMKPCPT